MSATTLALVLAVVINLGLGVLLGAVGGLLGIGGGLIAIPILGALYGMDQHLAQGTALVMILPNVLIGFWRYHQRTPVDFRALTWMILLSIGAAALAAHFASLVGSSQLRSAFAVFLIALAAYFIWQMRWQLRAHPAMAPKAVWPARFTPVVGVISGLMSGLFTIGGGLVSVPALVSLFGMKQTQAQGIALALVIPASVTALFSYAQAGNVDWHVGIPLALGGLVSVSWGVALAYRLPAVKLRLSFCVVLVGTAIAMLVRG
jgi:uncharacterized membrane protein YfcA